MVRIGKELQDRLLQLVTATICRDYLCIVRQWGDSVTPARRRMLFAKESVLKPIKFLTTCYSLLGNEMWGKNWTAPSFEEPRQFTVKSLRGNITFNQYLLLFFADKIILYQISSYLIQLWFYHFPCQGVLHNCKIIKSKFWMGRWCATLHEILAKCTCSEYLQVGQQMLFLVAPLDCPCLKSPQQTK